MAGNNMVKRRPGSSGGGVGGVANAVAYTGAAGDDVITTQVTGDTQKRLVVNANGVLEWGLGMIAPDVNLYHGAADELKTDDTFIAAASGAGASLGPIGPGFKAALAFGLANDTRLYRDSSGVLRTPGGVTVDGALSVAGNVGFYATTPIAQRASAAQAAVATTSATNITPWGFSTQAQADAIITLLNEVRAAFVALGLIKGSA